MEDYDTDEILGAAGIGGAIVGGGGGAAVGWIVALIVVILIVVAGWWMWQQAMGLGGALARQGWVMWTQNGCVACRRQLALIGSSAKYVQTRRCGPGPCPVRVFPTWINSRTHERRTGLQPRNELKSMANW